MARGTINFKHSYITLQSKRKASFGLVTLLVHEDAYPSCIGTLLAKTLLSNAGLSVNLLAIEVILKSTEYFTKQEKERMITTLKPNSKPVFNDFLYDVIQDDGKIYLKVFQVVNGRPRALFNGKPEEFLVELQKEDNKWN